MVEIRNLAILADQSKNSKTVCEKIKQKGLDCDSSSRMLAYQP
jgi:hypothetical protein